MIGNWRAEGRAFSLVSFKALSKSEMSQVRHVQGQGSEEERGEASEAQRCPDVSLESAGFLFRGAQDTPALSPDFHMVPGPGVRDAPMFLCHLVAVAGVHPVSSTDQGLAAEQQAPGDSPGGPPAHAGL